MGIPMLKIRRSRERLISNMGIPILVRRHIYSEMVRWVFFNAHAWVLIYFQMSQKRAILAACALFSLALVVIYSNVFGTSGVVKLQLMHYIYTTASRSPEIDETTHAEISRDFNHLHHTTTSDGNYHNITESAKPRDVEKEINITKHENVKDVENIVNSVNRVRVIINAKFRTGSSFTGELFIKHSAFAYYFEPLHFFADIKTGKRISEDKILWTLERVLNCTITDTDLDNKLVGEDAQWWKPFVLCGYKRGKHCERIIFWSLYSLSARLFVFYIFNVCMCISIYMYIGYICLLNICYVYASTLNRGSFSICAQPMRRHYA